MGLLNVIRTLRLRHGLAICEIARRTGLSRNTIKKHLKAGTVEPQPACRRTGHWVGPATGRACADAARCFRRNCQPHRSVCRWRGCHLPRPAAIPAGNALAECRGHRSARARDCLPDSVRPPPGRPCRAASLGQNDLACVGGKDQRAEDQVSGGIGGHDAACATAAALNGIPRLCQNCPWICNGSRSAITSSPAAWPIRA
ncbi:putative transcriptional regulator, XRE family [Rhodobacter ferrooxidans]|uniref:Putative transcriptional regulator, XRE family n=1 Tax=Rhodobacter ferrooxidans TaxID=371731 RepID=C8S428_9RHOB|nr:putative transcriptional regulator, XRE family [Rhodobacter sp. SW2]